MIKFEDLVEGMKVTGKVKNVVDFGAFVEIGIKESALIHVSEMSDRFVKDPMDALKVGDVREFRIISIDPARKRIGLSLKSGESRLAAHPERPRGEAAPSREEKPTVAGERDSGGRRVAVARKPEKSCDRRPSPPSREKEDDGMTYNPFADLLKGRK